MNKKKQLLIVANTAWSIYNFRHGLLENLLKNDYQLTTLAPNDEFSGKLALMGCNVLHLSISARGVNPLEDIKLLYRLYKIYSRLKPDFIIHYTIKPNIYGAIAANMAKIPCICVTTGLGYTFVNKGIITKIVQLLYKFAFRTPKEIFFLNEDDRQQFLKYKLVKEYKAVLLHGEGVNTTHFSPMRNQKNDRKTRFLLIARMLWDKGIGEYIEAARILRQEYPQAVFQLLGACDVANPSAISRNQISIWENEGIVEYLGTTQDVRPAIAQADCVVLPSYREGIPRTMIESAAMAKPLITSDAAGCRDVVRDGETGFIFPVKDVAALADCCRRILDLPAAEREKMGQAGRAFMEDVFDEKKVIAQYMAMLQKYDVISH